MRPSFFTLFKRGRYSRPPQPLESKDGSTVGASGAMNESERFVAAAIAFAWRYDEPQFRDHFWKSVCRFNDDPELTDKAEIRVEPYRWADLLITNPTRKPAGFGFDKGNWFLVVELLTSDKEPARSLKCLVSPPSSYLAWFGYKEKKEVRRPWVLALLRERRITKTPRRKTPDSQGLLVRCHFTA